MGRPRRVCGCGGICAACRRCASAARHKARNPGYGDKYTARGQALIEAAKNLPCADCGHSYPHYVMDFDHRDPSTKLFAIGSISRATNVEKLEAEIAKCDVVCSNCHRERTYTQSGGHHRAARQGEPAK